jgi:Uma2 family endonuclease
MLIPMFDAQDPGSMPIRPLKRSEYDQLGELGCFADEHVELLRGQIVPMSPIGARHGRLTMYLTRYVIERLDRTYDVSPALPFAASEYSEPEPDLMIVLHDDSRTGHPSSALLIMEFSDSSIQRDRLLKRSIYAEAGVPEYWIFDLSKEGRLTVEVYTDPLDGEYATKQVLRDGDVLRATRVPLEVPISDLPR